MNVVLKLDITSSYGTGRSVVVRIWCMKYMYAFQLSKSLLHQYNIYIYVSGFSK